MLIDTEKVIVPNWFNKIQIEDSIDEKLTSKQFQEFKNYLLNSEISNDVSDLIFNYYQEFKEFTQNAKK